MGQQNGTTVTFLEPFLYDSKKDWMLLTVFNICQHCKIWLKSGHFFRTKREGEGIG
jgi:hypothetical protein